jgi:hypothetical protein
MVFSPFGRRSRQRADRYLLPATQRLAAVFGKNDRQDATLRRGAYIDERNSPGRGIKRELRAALCRCPPSAIRRIFTPLAPAPIMAVDPNLSFPHKGRNSDKSGFSTRLAMMGWKADR